MDLSHIFTADRFEKVIRQGIFLLLILIISPGHTRAQNLDSLLQNKRSYHTENIGNYPLPKIDGLLDDHIWELGEWHGDFTQQQPVGGARGTEETFVKVLYDRSNLFVAIICQDSEPDRIRDIFTRRDELLGDMTGIAIDSYFDKRTAFEFNLTAAGQKVDIKHQGDYQWDLNWDAVWDGATSQNDTAWIAEMKIPFSQMRYANKEEHVWGMHVWRWISRKFEEDQWQLIPKEAPAMVYLFGELKGVENIRSSRQVEFLPYALSSLSRFANEGFGSPKFNGGIDAKVGISSDYTLDLSINPDFGQVEADPSVLNLTSFETFFEEKRPFFLEGTEIFDFELDGDIPYYSRRIGSAPSFPGSYHSLNISEIPDRTTILGSAKLTGKSKKGLSVGLISGLTAKESAKATDEEGNEKDIRVVPLSNYLASRIKREFKEGTTIAGGAFSLVNRISQDSISRELQPASAMSGGLDLLHHWDNRNYFFEVKTIASQLNGSADAILRKQLAHNHRFQRPDAGHLEVDSLKESLTGHGGLVKIGKKGGKFNFSVMGHYRSPGLNLNDMGYIRQSDFIGERALVSYDMNEPGRWIRNYTLQFFQEALWSFGGESTRNQTGFNFSAMNQKLLRFGCYFGYNFSHLDTRVLRGGPALRIDPQYYMGFYIGSNNTRDFYGNIQIGHTAFGLKNYSQENFRISLTWMPIKKLRFTGILYLDQERYHQQYVTTIHANNTSEYIVGNINRHTGSVTFRGELFLTPELSLQYYGSPYYSVGKYEAFSRVNRASSKDIDDRLERLDLRLDPGSWKYYFNEDPENLSFSDPDFSFMQFRSNLVFRWEYKLGSTLYLVWSHDRSGYESVYNPIRDITGDLFGLEGNHTFMVKLNFWFSL